MNKDTYIKSSKQFAEVAGNNPHLWKQLIGKQIIHSKYGKGFVASINGGEISIKFKNRLRLVTNTRKFSEAYITISRPINLAELLSKRTDEEESLFEEALVQPKQMNINQVILIGYAATEPKIIYLARTKECFCRFVLATIEESEISNGNFLNFFDLELWNYDAEFAKAKVSQGDLIGVVGSLHFSGYEINSLKSDQPFILVDQLSFIGEENRETKRDEIPDYEDENYLIETHELDEDDFYDLYNHPQVEFNENYSKEGYDISVDYGCLEDYGNKYEQFHSLGKIDELD